jgi:hypothetical protein
VIQDVAELRAGLLGGDRLVMLGIAAGAGVGHSLNQFHDYTERFLAVESGRLILFGCRRRDDIRTDPEGFGATPAPVEAAYTLEVSVPARNSYLSCVRGARTSGRVTHPLTGRL